ncbi:unnamed protein product [Taenia asiatica]|uniref:C2H2-type domain-containing protein n=1 Tax=Taenia asiatica TaxID=60517 RepID=A0A0R3VXZ0_TAEAS|nr:unnamed protein product [Taenia asiatica]
MGDWFVAWRFALMGNESAPIPAVQHEVCSDCQYGFGVASPTIHKLVHVDRATAAIGVLFVRGGGGGVGGSGGGGGDGARDVGVGVGDGGGVGGEVDESHTHAHYNEKTKNLQSRG